MKKARGTFWMRSGILLLAVLFGVLVYWSVGFLLNDIKVFRRPDRSDFFKQHIDHSLQENLDSLQAQLQELEHQHTLLNQQRVFIKDSSSSLQVTVDNLFTLRDRDQQLISTNQFEQILASLDKIIEIQKEFKTTADRYIEITNDKYAVRKEIAALQTKMTEQETATRNRYSEVLRRQRMKTTMLRLTFLLPLVLVCTVILVKKRNSIYRMIYGSAAIAVYVKTALFIHERFPSPYFKYIIIACLLGLVGWGFTWLIRRLVTPKLDTLLKQYRQAYERFLCPVCEYPIRTGPRKYLYWTRRTIHKTALTGNQNIKADDEQYSCPACGTGLFDKCDSCGKIRHSLLPNCLHCGDKKIITGEAY